MIFKKKHFNADAIVITLLKALNFHIEPEIIIDDLNRHPDYPSLLAVSDVLTSFNIENEAFSINCTDLPEVPCPFIAHTRFEEDGFVVIHKVDNGSIFLSGEKWTYSKMQLSVFEKHFKGIVLVAEQNEDSRDRSGSWLSFSKLLSFRLAISAAALVFIIALSLNFNHLTEYSWQTLLLVTVKSVGLTTSILLLVQSIDKNNPVIQIFCGGAKSNCSDILSSKAANVFEGLSWSEVGFFYFAGTWLLTLFGNLSDGSIWVLLVLNYICLPYTIYSIYYQSRVAKQWCVLCCTIQGLFWLEFAILSSFPLNHKLAFPELRDMGVIFICMLAPISCWWLIKPTLLKANQIQPLKDQLRKFRYSTELFNAFLNSRAAYEIPAKEWSISLGNEYATNVITIVSDPFCPPCSTTHALLDILLESRDDLQARIVFAPSGDEKDHRALIVKHLMALNSLSDPTLVKQALSAWYKQKQKNYESWASAYPVKIGEAGHEGLQKQKQWCDMTKVNQTPTIFFNGVKLPPIYPLLEIKYMLQ
jgi:uncharacterized membrane protein/glutaredoxin